MSVRHSAQIVVIGVEALGRLALGALDLGLLQLGRDRPDHARRHLVLQFEDIVECAVEAIRPEVRRRSGVDQLAGDAHPVPALRTLPSST